MKGAGAVTIPASATVSDTNHNVGDTDNDNQLDTDEVWSFSCQYTLAGPTGTDTEGSVTNTALGYGTVVGTGDNLRWCNATDFATPPSGVKCSQDERDLVKVTIKYGDKNSTTL